MRGFGQKNLPKDSSGEFIVTKGNELSEIKNVKEFLDPDETVHIVAKQTRRKFENAWSLLPQKNRRKEQEGAPVLVQESLLTTVADNTKHDTNPQTETVKEIHSRSCISFCGFEIHSHDQK